MSKNNPSAKLGKGDSSARKSSTTGQFVVSKTQSGNRTTVYSSAIPAPKKKGYTSISGSSSVSKYSSKKPITKSLEHTIEEAHDPLTGFVDAKRLAAATGISLVELGEILKRSVRGLQKNPSAHSIQSDLTRVVSLYVGLLDQFDREDRFVKIWLRAPHPDLGKKTPLSFLVAGHIDVVESLLAGMESGQSS